MIPVRVPADAKPLLVGGVRKATPAHPVYRQLCPIDDRPIAGEPFTLVHVGTHPDDQKETGWTTGAAVAVHAACVAAAGAETKDA